MTQNNTQNGIQKNSTPSNTQSSTKSNGHLKEWVVFLSLCGVATVFFGYQKAKRPALAQYGIKDWQTVCEGENRIYRLKSQNKTATQGTYTKKSLTSRDLKFLDKEGKILYFTAFFDPNSLDKDGVWRFQYRKGERLADRMFRKTENHPFFHKILSKVFQSDYAKYKDKNIKKALYGDEEAFEVAKDFTKLSIVRKNKKAFDIPCQPL